MDTLQFKEITIDMRDTVLSYTRPLGLQSSEYTFASLLIWGDGGKITLAEEDGALYIRYTFPRFPMFMLAPLCRDMSAYPAAIARAEEHLRSQGAKPAFRGVTRYNAGYFEAAGYTLSPDRDNFDYVYNMEDLRTLTGKKYHGKRNHINRFMAEHSFEYVKLTKADAGECMEMHRHWAEDKGVSGGSIAGEARALELAFRYMEELGMVAGGIAMNGSLKAFTMAERLDGEMAVVYFEKADADIQGLYPLINQQFIEHELKDMRLINREEDMGIEGLRKAKLSYHPAMFVEKYGAVKHE